MDGPTNATSPRSAFGRVVLAIIVPVLLALGVGASAHAELHGVVNAIDHTSVPEHAAVDNDVADGDVTLGSAVRRNARREDRRAGRPEPVASRPGRARWTTGGAAVGRVGLGGLQGPPRGPPSVR